MSGRWRDLLLAVIAIPALTVSLRAQAPLARRQLGLFRDSLRAINDPLRLKALERIEERTPHARNDAMPLVRTGFIRLRRAEVDTDFTAITAAGQAFDAAIDVQPAWPVAWVGRGLADVNRADHESAVTQTVRRYFTADPAVTAARAFAHSGELDAEYVDGLLKVTNLALQYRHTAQLKVALLALRRAAAFPVGRQPAVMLARARIEEIAGSPDSAAAAAAVLLARYPDNAGALLATAHVALATGDARGAAAWFAGLAVDDSATQALYRAELLPILPDSVVQRYDAAPAGERGAVIRNFFEAGDPSHLRSIDERLREHYRRYDEARAQFDLPTQGWHADSLAIFAPTGREMDERGIVWLLHGRPDGRSSLNLLGAPPNESWRYKRDDGSELLFNFVAVNRQAGFKRVASAFDILAFTAPFRLTGHGDPRAMAQRGEAVQTYGASWTAQTAQTLLYSLENVSPIYSAMLSRGRDGALDLQRMERATGDSSIALGESWNLHYELPLDATVDAVAAGFDGGTPVIHASFAIAGNSLPAVIAGDQPVYPIRMRVAVLRGAAVVARVDTTRNFVARAPIPDGGSLLGTLPLRVPPGDYTVRIAVETPTRGYVSGPIPAHVIAPGGTPLALSDLALGARSVHVSWHSAHGDSLFLNPLGRFHASEVMELYFDVAGLDAGAAYEVNLSVFKADEQNADLRVSFNAVAGGSPDAVHRALGLEHLKPGRYHLQVTLSTAAGQRFTRRREFTVIK